MKITTKMILRNIVIGVFVLVVFVKADDLTLTQYMNESADPCEDFYEYACGNFKNIYPLPKDNSVLTVDHFTLLEDRLTILLNYMLSNVEQYDDPQAVKKAKSAYKSCMNMPEIDPNQIPETAIVDAEKGFPLVEATVTDAHIAYSWNDIADAISKYGIPMIFGIRVYPNVLNATNNLLYVSRDLLENPTLLKPHREQSYEHLLEKDIFETVTERSKKSKVRNLLPFDVFLRKIAYKLKRNCYEPAPDDVIEQRIEEMSNFMRGVYLGGEIPENVTIGDLPDYSATLAQLGEWTKRHFQDTVEIDWVEFMRRVFQNSDIAIGPDTEIMTYSGLEEYLYGILNWVQLHSPEVVKNFVLTRVFLYMAPDSDAETREAFEEYYRQKNYMLYPRWQYCTRQIMDSVGSIGMSLALAYDYQSRYYNADGFKTVVQMIKDLQHTFKDLILDIPWMDKKMKEIAKDKLKNMITIMGYPDFITDVNALDKFYDNLDICEWDHYSNAQKIRAFKFSYQLSQLPERDRTYWSKSPFETNAYYNRQNNRIIIPVAMLNPEFFGSNNQILNYARLGSIIGHEITHGFDVEGQKYDKDGSLHPWSTHSNFTNYSKCFVDQYNKYYIAEINSYVNGTNTLNENLADNGGVKESYLAMRKVALRMGKKIKNDTPFTTDQLFFLGFATMWCSNPSERYLKAMKHDLHAMSKWRVNGVLSNMYEFSEAFECPANSKMNPKKKCKLW